MRSILLLALVSLSLADVRWSSKDGIWSSFWIPSNGTSICSPGPILGFTKISFDLPRSPCGCVERIDAWRCPNNQTGVWFKPCTSGIESFDSLYLTQPEVFEYSKQVYGHVEVLLERSVWPVSEPQQSLFDIVIGNLSFSLQSDEINTPIKFKATLPYPGFYMDAINVTLISRFGDAPYDLTTQLYLYELEVNLKVHWW